MYIREIRIYYAVPFTKNKITARQIEDDTINLIVHPLNSSSHTYLSGQGRRQQEFGRTFEYRIHGNV